MTLNKTLFSSRFVVENTKFDLITIEIKKLINFKMLCGNLIAALCMCMKKNLSRRTKNEIFFTQCITTPFSKIIKFALLLWFRGNE